MITTLFILLNLFFGVYNLFLALDETNKSAKWNWIASGVSFGVAFIMIIELILK